jgi:hypothetical protein
VEAEVRLFRLADFFRERRIASGGSAKFSAYIVKCLVGKAANASINRELAVRGRMLKLAYEAGKL